MFSLNLPAFDAKIVVRDGKRSIFDVIRRRYVALTPEEWVRQHFVHFLMAHKSYPQALMANEVQVQLNGTKKRCDTVLYRRDLTARMIIEYKAPEVEITQKVFDQIFLTTQAFELLTKRIILTPGLKGIQLRDEYGSALYLSLSLLGDIVFR